MVRIDWAVRPSRPMTLPTSSFATRSSMSRLCSPSISVTSTAPGSSTRAFAIVSISSFNAMLRLHIHRTSVRRTHPREHWEAQTLGGLLLGTTLRRGRGTFGRLALEQSLERVGRLRTPTTPVVETFAVDHQDAGVAGRVVGTNSLDKATPTGAALIGHDDAVLGRLFRADAAQTDVNGHRQSFVQLSRPLTSELSTGGSGCQANPRARGFRGAAQATPRRRQGQAG